MSKAKAIFRLPGEHIRYGMEGNLSEEMEEVSFSNPENCFYFSPFNSGSKAYSFSSQHVHASPSLPDFFDTGFDVPFEVNVDSNQEYTNKVAQAVAEIKNGNSLKKVVLARCHTHKLHPGFNPSVFFDSLCANFSNAFCYVFSSKAFGTWIGASPELLLHADAMELKTVALAGTLPAAEINWDEKEKKEQELVEVFIENALKKTGYDFLKTPARELVSGSLKHLQSTYTASLHNNDEAKLRTLLQQLNPTPAVCGLPRESSLAYIHKQERLERRFYSGFVGVGLHGKNTLFVNLRCGHLNKNQIHLYAGAGITSQSLPPNECLETERKLHALGKFL